MGGRARRAGMRTFGTARSLVLLVTVVAVVAAGSDGWSRHRAGVRATQHARAWTEALRARDAEVRARDDAFWQGRTYPGMRAEARAYSVLNPNGLG
ncbi:MAG: hypothetical protein JWM98_1287 [Thermoleophilia bacterium]|nr:hypothetical protein [Thermoleophilia bacterium]